MGVTLPLSCMRPTGQALTHVSLCLAGVELGAWKHHRVSMQCSSKWGSRAGTLPSLRWLRTPGASQDRLLCLGVPPQRSHAMAELGVPDDTTELHDSPEELQHKVDRLAELVTASRKVVVHTGAGISTSAGIPDFRGPEGVWTLRAKGLKAKGRPGSYSPTLTHMVIVAMLESGRLYHLVSQNTDGLHIRSGIPTDKISELHGNTNMEKCSKCGHRFIRSFRTRTATKVHDHLTGRKCERCGGALKDTIINFGESLPSDQLSKADEVSQEADLAIVLGTSLKVSPANDLPLTTANRGKPLVIVNLQRTPLDSICSLRIFAKTDEVMAMLAEKLGMDIPPPRDVAAASGDTS